MFEYLKRVFSHIDGKIKIDTYPKYYEENNCIIREEKDGKKYIVTLDKDNNEVIAGIYNG